MSETYNNAIPVPRDFDCRLCGHHVHVEQRSDHRTVFCSAYCEREFWRHRSRYDRKKNIDTGHVVQAWQLERVID